MTAAADTILFQLPNSQRRGNSNSVIQSKKDVPLPARRRDLVVQEQHYQGQVIYYVKDPLTLKYFRFAPAEYQVFELLDGKNSLDQVHESISRELILREVSANDLRSLIQRWQSLGLLQDEGEQATSRVLSAQERSKKLRGLGWISGILYMKVRAFDPDPLLNRLYPFVSWMFRPIGILFALCSMFAAVLLVAARFEEFTSQPELQNFQAFFNVQNIVWFWMSVAIVKVLHELGHGLTCKHFGGECHAIGLLLMCFTPCLYCDVSDSWMLPNKWHRIAIAAAGIYVELLMASLATFIWWFTVPGMIHSIAFSVMLFGSVQTILINANPLLRFDGYYMMSDFLEVPNLRAKSFAFTKYYLKKWFWGTREGAPGSGGLGFALFAVTSSIYRTILTFSVIWFFSRVLEPYKMAVFGYGLTAMAVTNMLILPMVMALISALRNPSAMRPLSWWRPFMALVLLAGLAAIFFYVPIPRRAYAVLALEPERSAVVVTPTGGRIVNRHIVAGGRVEEGDPLIELDNPELRQQFERMEQQRQMLKVQSQVASATLDPARVQTIQVALRELDSQLAAMRERIDQLVLKAPCAGRIIPDVSRTPPPSNASATIVRLASWKGTVLSHENLGANLEAGTTICQIAATDECIAVAVLSQSQIESVKVGQVAAIKLDAFPAETFLGDVEEVSVQDAEQVSPQLLNLHGSELPAITSGPGAGQLAEIHYHVRIRLTGLTRGELTDWPKRLKTGLRGRTWIRTGTHTPAEATWRWLCQVFQW